ncbi:MAG TPA: efflux RND transporter periplasmic adaptor subunit [Terriglobales bacterium]|nr:efflux RND transporter periplasmic adaptor subunit [Terriglobales bacterium]
MKRVIIPIVLIAAIAAGIFAYRRSSNGKQPKDQVVLSGNIEAHESVVGFRTQGRIVELPVQEGMTLNRGDLIAKLDDSDYRQQVAIDDAMIRTRAAELQLATAGGRDQDVRAAEQAVADAKADLELKRIDFERYDSLYKRDAISAQTRDAAATALKRSQANLARLQENLSAIREGTRKEQIAVNRANLAAAKQNAGMSKVRLGFTVLDSPISGVILVRQAELGEVVTAGTPVVSIADLDNIWVRAYISETELAKIRLGQEASVHTDTYPDKRYKGRVSFIASQAEFTPKSVETHKERVALVYRVKVAVENPNHELKPGMPADVTIKFAN